MFGPSDFASLGWLRLGHVVDRLADIAVPTLLVGRFDELSLSTCEMQGRIAGSRLEFFESSSHMPFISESRRDSTG